MIFNFSSCKIQNSSIWGAVFKILRLTRFRSFLSGKKNNRLY
ncbi:hypothetical protein HMPREF9123_0837 [Neisseria bacilliformis ATCC BAA-1200]|uniref:Uncharacterized protein n=1 Tax=Neisseria bacilliformis ATCC BAA-1200 TaxID=888742 RepID=F2BAT3_9NEIS|nr:hypothetical protein HMPREF9123_0837 [Neisseria bacilliformis ATCC BAA-1200]